MDLNELFKMGADMIKGNSDDATTNLDSNSIADALSNVLGGENGSLDLSKIFSNLSESGLGEIVGSWLGDGENKPISVDSITDLLGGDKIAEFASSLGLSEESAKNALSEAIPNLVDKATSGEESIFSDMLEKVGGVDGAMDMLGKMFK
jgi:uncharacterized protein YidB (DUF937 family)